MMLENRTVDWTWSNCLSPNPLSALAPRWFRYCSFVPKEPNIGVRIPLKGTQDYNFRRVRIPLKGTQDSNFKRVRIPLKGTQDSNFKVGFQKEPRIPTSSGFLWRQRICSSRTTHLLSYSVSWFSELQFIHEKTWNFLHSMYFFWC